MTEPNDKNDQTFEQAAEQGRRNIVSEIAGFLWHEGKWWLIPIVVVLAVAALLVIGGGGGIAPFIYTLF